MNQVLLNLRLGVIPPPSFQRYQYERLLHSLTPDPFVTFASHRPLPDNTSSASHASRPSQDVTAHTAGVNCIAIDPQSGRYLVSGGADAAIRIWDLESQSTTLSNTTSAHTFHPRTSLTKGNPSAHTHSITSLSIYPFDSSPTTLLSTSYDNTLKLTPLSSQSSGTSHIFTLPALPYTHSLSPLPSAPPLIAVATASHSPTLLDLRTGLTTHTLPGHRGDVYTLAWSPAIEHLLATGAADGRVLFFDVRSARGAVASLDLDDGLGVVGEEADAGFRPRRALEAGGRAHTGAVTGVRWISGGKGLVTCGHDQRVRVWDAVTGRNELVYFGPRIRNRRVGEAAPLVTPNGCGDVILWANDDDRGEVLMMDLKDGRTLRVLKIPGANRGKERAAGKLTSGGRIASLAWRVRAHSGSGLELYSGHGDGTIHRWKGIPAEDEEGQEDETVDQADRKRKRKLALLDNLVEGLSKKTLVSI